MRIALVGFGSRGDVTPLAALAVRLQQEGHTVRFVTHADFESLAVHCNVPFHSVPGSYQDLLATHEGRRALGVPRASPLGMSGLFMPFRDCALELFQQAWRACEDADALVCSPLAAMAAALIAQARDLPLALGEAVPSPTSRSLPHASFPALPLGPWYNLLTHALAGRLLQRGAAPVFQIWLAEARRLRPSTASRPVRLVTLAAVSPSVVPRPADWPASAYVTGYWFLPSRDRTTIPAGLRAFVEQGPPPICLGFGSMADDNPQELKRIVVNALDRLKLRAVVVAGSGGALFGFDGHENILEVPFADYDWLFPRVAAVVHQGGAGTAAFCLTAGVPQTIVPYCLDHTFWGWRMRAIGVASASIPRHKLTSRALAAGIRSAVENPVFRARAASLAPVIRAEDGLTRAFEILERHFETDVAAVPSNGT